MKMSASKCLLFVSGNKHEHMWAKIGDDQIWESRTVKLLGIKIDNEQKFDEYISNVCKKAQRKLTVLTRIKKYLDFKKLRLLLKTVFDSQFKYCPLTWMFYSRTTSNKINKLHERTLRLVYDDYVSKFEELLERDNSFTVHHYNIQTLCIELYKVFLVDSLKRYLVICLKEKILITICTHSLILLFRKLNLFIMGQIHFYTLDLLYGV